MKHSASRLTLRIDLDQLAARLRSIEGKTIEDEIKRWYAELYPALDLVDANQALQLICHELWAVRSTLDSTPHASVPAKVEHVNLPSLNTSKQFLRNLNGLPDNAKARAIEGRDDAIREATYSALNNCRLVAARECNRAKTPEAKESWQHILRFCKDGGVTGSVLRDAPALAKDIEKEKP